MRTNPETWRKSSYSGGGGNNCLEVAVDHPAIIPVRDSKNPHGPKLMLRPQSWSVFVKAVIEVRI
ncbi:DUF397 domain-containing protein [Streptomyces sp. NPDC091972]|uniref:DUF397 domain-containing protein n=1 Tax=Streptomyces sp. NPDC091972 TaxID=3366007 RepID=UPI00382C4B49